MIRLTRDTLPDYTVDSDYDLQHCADFLRDFTTPEVYEAYMDIMDARDKEYGSHSWSLLGLRFLYGQLFAKYMRYDNCGSFDSIVDIFGYCVLAVAYINQKGFPLARYNNGYKEYPSIYSLFQDNMSIWNEEYSNEVQLLQFFTTLVSMTARRIDARRENG